MSKLIFFIACFFSIQLIGQNLIPNPGFEKCEKCDASGRKELGIYQGANDPIDWHAATGGTPDFVSIAPHSGRRHGGFFVGFPKFEYLLNHFTECLKPGVKYQFSFWIRPSTQNPNYIIDEIGVYITKDPGVYNQANSLKQLTPTYQTPDGDFITASGYRQISFEYTAQGGEINFIVGRFRELGAGDTMFVGTKRPVNPSSEPVYYFVDDFEMTTPSAQIDLIPDEIVLCNGTEQTLNIPDPFNKFSILWSTADTTETTIANQEGEISVAVFLNDSCKTIIKDTTIVKIKKIEILIKDMKVDSICMGDTLTLKTDCDDCSKFLWSTNQISDTIDIMMADTFHVIASTNLCDSLFATKEIFPINDPIKNYIQFPNVVAPNGEEVNRIFQPVIKKNEEGRLRSMKLFIFNRWGQKVYESTENNARWIPGNDDPMDTYMYVCEIEYKDCDGIRKTSLKGTVTLVR